MKVLVGRNVNELLSLAVFTLVNGSQCKVAPRGKSTIEFPTPVCSVYERPCERVLFSAVRDANPFFHFMESLWILAGRKDVAWISQFNRRIKEYSDDGKVFGGAYGDRMRNVKCWGMENIDQIEEVVRILRVDPESRRAVIQIWDASRDLVGQTGKKDIPCNDLIMFKIRDDALHMTVCNRSNDLIWGCYGANAVHFSMLHEYLAAHIGVPVGVYRQVSDSLHVYTENPQWEKLCESAPYALKTIDPYKYGDVSPYPLLEPGKTMYGWDEDLKQFMENPYSIDYRHRFFSEVALPMQITWDMHKEERQGLDYVNNIEASDWRRACREWLERREENVEMD